MSSSVEAENQSNLPADSILSSQGNNSISSSPLGFVLSFSKEIPEIQELKRVEAMLQYASNSRKQFVCASFENRTDLPEGFCFCLDCRRFRFINPSCNLRNCPRCQKKQSMRLFRKFNDFIKSIKQQRGKNLRMLMLSGFRVDVNAPDLRARCHTFFNVVSDYLAESYDGGLITLEWTWQGSELYVHAHALVYGGMKMRSEFGKEFAARLYEAGLITFWEMAKGYYEGEWYTWLATARSPVGGLSYSLKYVSKGVLLDDDQVKKLKGLRFVRTFGTFRGEHVRGNNYHAVCADCGGKIRAWFGIMSDWGPMDHPLKLKYVQGDPPPPLMRANSASIMVNP